MWKKNNSMGNNNDSQHTKVDPHHSIIHSSSFSMHRCRLVGVAQAYADRLSHRTGWRHERYRAGHEVDGWLHVCSKSQK